MKKDINAYFGISLIIHICFFILVTLKAGTPNYVVLPVEVRFYSDNLSEIEGPIAKVDKNKSVKNKTAQKISPKDKKILTKKKIVISTKDAADKKEKVLQQETKKEETVNVETPISPEPAQTMPGFVPGTAGNISASSGLTLDVANFPYTYYTNNLVRKIERSWGWSQKYGNLKTLVFFRIGKNGEVSGLSVKKTSGEELFDDQAMRSIALASPFPPLPSDFKEDHLGVYFEFAYTE